MVTPVLALDAGASRASAIFAVLTVLVDAFVVGVVLVWLVSRFVPSLRQLWRRWIEDLSASPPPAGAEGRSARFGPGDLALWGAFGIAAVCTGGSLWFSEVAGLPPCKLCWFQRVCMYPLTAVCGVAALRRDHRALWTALPLAVVGMAVSLYHVLLERFPSLETGSGCDPLNPCTIVWFRRFGFVSLPFMALSGFAGIVALVVLASCTAHRAVTVTSQELA